MKSKTFSSILLIWVFALAHQVCSTSESEVSRWQVRDIPETFSAKNPEAVRIRVEDVSKYSWMFLTDMKTTPAIDMGNDMIYHLELEEPSNDDKAINAARKAIGETPAVMEAAKKQLASVLRNDSNLNVPWENDAWLIRFLRLRDYNVSKTYKLIRSYYNFKAKNSFIYENLVPSNERDVAEKEVIGVLPNRDPAGSRIFVGRAKRWDPKKYTLLQLCRVGILLSETGAYEPATQLAGVQIIFDLDGLNWHHIRQFNPYIASLMVQWLLTSVPIRYQGIHIVNQPRIFWTLFNMFKPFLTKEIRSKLHFHGTNMKSLHRYIPATSLPDVYGGSFPKPSLSSYEWDVVLRSGDEEYAKIESYGIKGRA